MIMTKEELDKAYDSFYAQGRRHTAESFSFRHISIICERLNMASEIVNDCVKEIRSMEQYINETLEKYKEETDENYNQS